MSANNSSTCFLFFLSLSQSPVTHKRLKSTTSLLMPNETHHLNAPYLLSTIVYTLLNHIDWPKYLIIVNIKLLFFLWPGAPTESATRCARQIFVQAQHVIYKTKLFSFPLPGVPLYVSVVCPHSVTQQQYTYIYYVRLPRTVYVRYLFLGLFMFPHVFFFTTVLFNPCAPS